MGSWRISTLFDDRSGRSLPSGGAGVGATVIRADRGTLEPTYFSIGEALRMTTLFGLPTSSNPELLEALEYNNSYPIWVSAPSLNGRHGGVLIGASGSEALGAGLTTVPVSLTSVGLYEQAGTGDGSTVAFSYTLSRSTEYINNSMDIIVDGTSLALSGSDADPEVLSGTGVNGTYNRVTGALELTFDAAPASGAVIEANYNADLSSYYGLLVSKSPAAEYVGVMTSFDTDTELFSSKIYTKNTQGNWIEVNTSPVEYGFTTTAENGFGINVYIDNAFKDNDFIVPAVVDGATVTTFTDDSSVVGLSGGSRGDTVSGTDLAVGWDQFQSTRKYQISVFFDATADDSVPAKFSTLRTSYHKYARYILPTPNQSVSDTISWSLPVQDRGIAFYYGWFEIRNLYNNTGNVISTPMGEVSKNVADIMVQAFGGIAPAWINENGLGGQLTGGRIVRSIYDPDEAQLQSLDEARINPIVLDPNYGPMIMSRRTSAAGLSDYSFVDYSGLIDYAVKNIVEQVLPFQIVKLNDPAHRNIVVNKTNSILEPMTVAPRNVIREYAIKCDEENNNDEVLSREEFRLDVALKVTPKSRRVIFTFINTPQTSSVEEQFA